MRLRKVFGFLLVTILLSGCTIENRELDRMMSFRASLLSAMGCKFTVDITADYQNELYSFSMECFADEEGNLHFTVLKPESISGISGEITGYGGRLTFDNDTGLTFETLADGQVTPVTAPWLLIKTLRGGYVTSCAMAEDLMHVSVDDTYRDHALHMDIWFDAADTPKRAEILWKDRRVLSLDVTKFEIL